MRKKLLGLTVLFSMVAGMVWAQDRNCHTMDVLQEKAEKDPNLLQRMSSIEQQTRAYINRVRQGRAVTGVITIPVVVHVIYNNSSENISAAQIQSQIDVLNEDYRKLNSDVSQAPSEFAPLASDIELEFVLADTDPNGNPTSGITRKSSNRSSWGTNDAMKSPSQGGVAPWDASRYLNMWVCNIGGGILGYAQFPGGSLSTDGVVMSPQYFGSSDKGSGFYLSAPFDKGRTATHEVGHWLNLRHIWGDGGCSVDDFVSDTPVSGNPNYGCPNYPTNSCSQAGNDMTMNYMDYVDDECMYMFTTGQRTRMRALFDTGGFREGFVDGDGGGGDPGEVTYCTSQGNSVADEWIANVTVGSLNNSTGANGGYADFTSTNVDLALGQTYNVSLSPDYAGTVYNEYWRIWIDFNEDGDFTDANELVFDAGSVSNTTVTGTLSIPASVAEGTTRMRVSMKYNGAPTSCETFSYGEVEDYAVTIVSGGSTPTCDAPTGFSTSGVTTSSFTLNWGTVSGASEYDVQVRTAGSSSWNSYIASSNSLTLNSATAGTTYEWRVRTVCSSSNSAYSAIQTVTTEDETAVEYCTSQGNTTQDEWIEQVTFGSINNTSGSDGGYADYTNLSTSVNKGSSYTITIVPEWSGTTYREAYNVWVDWNQDGDFSDAGEAVYSRSRTTAGSVSGSFTVPSSAQNGATRMRVTMKYNANASPCETFTYGEVEDYTINVSGSARTAAASFKVDEISAFPNPVQTGETTLRFNVQEKMDVEISVYNVMGGRVLHKSLQQVEGTHDESLDLSMLKSGMYHVFVEANGLKEGIKLIKE